LTVKKGLKKREHPREKKGKNGSVPFDAAEERRELCDHLRTRLEKKLAVREKGTFSIPF